MRRKRILGKLSGTPVAGNKEFGFNLAWDYGESFVFTISISRVHEM
ncbi:hypothetical protein [Paenibacillus sp. FJAT-26967]|nr:hypothetical protein [Paenibacillus sp. FJAT-26967]